MSEGQRVELDDPRQLRAVVYEPGTSMPRLEKPLMRRDAQGKWASVRLADGSGDTKTYLGIYLGDMALGVRLGFKKDEPETLVVSPGMLNPCIYVPDLNRLVFGVESWWGTISSPEELRQISDLDIENVWYVRAMREMEAREATKN